MRTNRLLKLGCLLAVGALWMATPAGAVTDEARSEPNGDYDLMVGVASSTDKDKDGNPDTATNADKLLVRYTVCGRGSEETEPGVVQVVITIDGPGTVADRQVTDEADLETFSCVDRFVHDKVKRKWPSGDYTATVETDNGRDTATASGTIEIQQDKPHPSTR